MANGQNKCYQVILFGFLIFFSFNIISNYINKQKTKSKLIKNQTEKSFFNSKRNLDESYITTQSISNELDESNQASELQDSNKTDNISKIDLDDEIIDCPEKDKGYIKALIAITNSIIRKEIHEEDEA